LSAEIIPEHTFAGEANPFPLAREKPGKKPLNAIPFGAFGIEISATRACRASHF